MQHLTIFHVVATVLLILGSILTQFGLLFAGLLLVGCGLLVIVYEYHKTRKIDDSGYKFYRTVLLLLAIPVALIITYFLVSSRDIAYATVAHNEKVSESEFITAFDFNVKSEFLLSWLDIEITGKHITSVEPQSVGLYNSPFEEFRGDAIDILAHVRLKNVSPGVFRVKVKSIASDPNISLVYSVQYAGETSSYQLLVDWIKKVLEMDIPLYFLFISIALVSVILYLFQRFISEYWKHIKIIKSLTTTQKLHLKEFIVREERVYSFDVFDGIALGLVSLGVLKILNASRADNKAVFWMEDWAWNILRKRKEYLG